VGNNPPRLGTQEFERRDLERQNEDDDEGPFSDRARYIDDVTPSLPPASRPSMDAYGAFQDPAPSGYGSTPIPPGMSRTMAYADPYAALRASIQAGRTGNTPSPSNDQPPSLPPNYLYPDHRT